MFGHTLRKKSNRLARVRKYLSVSWALQYKPDGLDCQREQTGCFDSFISAKVVKTDYLAATKTVLTVDKIAIAAGQKNIFFQEFLLSFT